MEWYLEYTDGEKSIVKKLRARNYAQAHSAAAFMLCGTDAQTAAAQAAALYTATVTARTQAQAAQAAQRAAQAAAQAAQAAQARLVCARRLMSDTAYIQRIAQAQAAAQAAQRAARNEIDTARAEKMTAAAAAMVYDIDALTQAAAQAQAQAQAAAQRAQAAAAQAQAAQHIQAQAQAAQRAAQAAARKMKYKIYPTQAAALALSVAYATARGGIMRGGTDTQRAIYADLWRARAACEHSQDYSTQHINSLLTACGADSQDYYGIAQTAIQTAIAHSGGAARAVAYAYKKLNKAIHAQRAAAAREYSLEYITDGGGAVVSYKGAISSILRCGEKYTPIDTDGGAAAMLCADIAQAAAHFTPRQRDIARLLGYGYSMRHIARHINCDVSTVSRNVEKMRGILSDTLRGTYTGEKVLQDIYTGAAQAQRTEKEKARREKDAQRAKKYRANKKAQAQAQASAEK